MKLTLVVACVVLALLTVQSAFAGNNICILASQTVNIAPEKFEDFYKQNVAMRLLTGQGKILRIKQTGADGVSGNFLFLISCSEKAIIVIQTNEFEAKKSRAKEGNMVSITGESTKMYKSHGIVYCHMRATIR